MSSVVLVDKMICVVLTKIMSSYLSLKDTFRI